MAGYIRLRPHHLLCLPGYKGYTYSNKQKTNWDMLSLLVRYKPQLPIVIVEGRDALCVNCPNKKGSKHACNELIIKALDEKVRALLDLQHRMKYKYGDLIANLKGILTPEKHKELCGDCHWRTFGLCEDTFAKNNSLVQITLEHPLSSSKS